MAYFWLKRALSAPPSVLDSDTMSTSILLPVSRLGRQKQDLYRAAMLSLLVMSSMVAGEARGEEGERILPQDAMRWLDEHPAPPHWPATKGTSDWDAAERRATVSSAPSSGPTPHHAARGIHVGKFRAFPKISSTVSWDDNVYKTSTNIRSDQMTQVKATLKMLTHWAKNQLEGNYEASIRRHQALKTENTTDHLFSLNTRLAPTRRLEFDMDGRLALEHDERGTPGKASAKFSNLFSDAIPPNAWQQGTITGTARFKLRRLTTELTWIHGERNSLNNAQEAQDNTWNNAGLIFKWALTPKTSLLVDMGQKETVYDLSPKLDNTETRLLGGLTWKVTARTESQTTFGVTSKNMTHAEGKDNKSLTWNSKTSWKPRSRTQFTFGTNRNFQMNEEDNTGFIVSGAQLGVRHTLAVDWDLFANVDVSQSVYETAKEETFWSSKVGTEYKLPHWFSLGMEIVRKTKASTVSGAEFESTGLMFTLTGAL